jgi:hypothetical protein
MIKEGNISLLNQLVETLESSFEKFKKAYDKKDSENFNKQKKIIIQTQRKISEIAI